MSKCPLCNHDARITKVGPLNQDYRIVCHCGKYEFSSDLYDQLYFSGQITESEKKQFSTIIKYIREQNKKDIVPYFTKNTPRAPKGNERTKPFIEFWSLLMSR